MKAEPQKIVTTKVTLLLTVPHIYLSRLHMIYWDKQFHIWNVFEGHCRISLYTYYKDLKLMNVIDISIWLHKKHKYCFFRACLPFTFDKQNSLLFRLDSSLEAFSYNQTHVSFATLACQPVALPIVWINGSSRTELNYYQNYW